ncbi:TetR/AcrR family transcriptional regulator [Paraburkholderia youngii]|uniref:TetR/AcrR family transcriptional regulator n=1 Tax=Paraburkholderia youngii TaxID=2782701 RepID=A0A7Y6JZA1_9BURK|nr:TetR family transcriptional regulator [Paraburkholderia youngii]NUY01480.1 TetR/AcrR family transcriptional regulator [Paraburkholderia youngii]
MKDLTIALSDVAGPGKKGAPRGRRETRVPEILEAAISVFAAAGNDGFTQRGVAAAANIRLATLQHYFGSRDSLLKATIEELAQRYLRRFHELGEDARLTPEARLHAVLDETFNTLVSPGNLISPFALECWCLAEHHPEVRELMEEVSEKYQSLFSGLVAQINPDLPAQECRIRGALIYSHWQGLIVFLRRSGRNAPDLAAFRKATGVVWTALGKTTS